MNNETNRLAQLIATAADKELGTRPDGQPRRQDKAAAMAIEAEYLFIRRDEGGVLDKALQSLREANPDPSVVEALAAKTVNERNNPYTFQNIFVRSFIPGDIAICQLCGMQAPIIYKGPGVHPATQHVTWHNQLHQAGIEAA